jgi:hypothetical protein
MTIAIPQWQRIPNIGATVTSYGFGQGGFGEGGFGGGVQQSQTGQPTWTAWTIS